MNALSDHFAGDALCATQLEQVKGGSWRIVGVLVEAALIIMDDPDDFKEGFGDGCTSCK